MTDAETLKAMFARSNVDCRTVFNHRGGIKTIEIITEGYSITFAFTGEVTLLSVEISE